VVTVADAVSLSIRKVLAVRVLCQWPWFRKRAGVCLAQDVVSVCGVGGWGRQRCTSWLMMGAGGGFFA